jgi:predicted PurR-regulated permease PerM
MKRPVLVTVIGIVMIVVGLLQVGVGILLVSQRNDATVLADANATTNELTSIAVGLLVVGAISVLLAFGLLNGSRVARGLIGVLEIGQIAAGVYMLVKLDSTYQGSAIGQIIGALIVLYFLFGTEKAKTYFAR